MAGRPHPRVGRDASAEGRHAHPGRAVDHHRPRSGLAGWAGYGHCPSHSRFYWGAKRPAPGTAIVTDKGLSGEDTETFFASPDLGLTLIRPARKDEKQPRYFPNWLRQRVEAIIWTLNASITHCAFFSSGILEQSSLGGFYLGTQAAAASAADVHGGEFAALDFMQNGLPGDAEGGGGLLQW